jgi:ribosomal protein S18 acetylase RimI-like enzyme
MITIRPFTLEQVDTIVRQRSAMFIDMGRDPQATRLNEPIVREWLLRHMAAGTYLGFEAVGVDGTSAGGVGLAILDMLPPPGILHTRRGYVYNVYVEPDFRRQGIASLLIQQCLAQCRHMGIGLVSLHASDEGRGVYEKLGFTPTNEMRLILT